MDWELGNMQQTLRWVHNCIKEILIGTGDGTCRRSYHLGDGLLFHLEYGRWAAMMDKAIAYYTLPLQHGRRTADYANVF